jgi:hypothetical protein
MVMVISALEMLLKEMGYVFDLGTGLKAAGNMSNAAWGSWVD